MNFMKMEKFINDVMTFLILLIFSAAITIATMRNSHKETGYDENFKP